SYRLFSAPTCKIEGLAYIIGLVAVEWFQRTKQHGLEIDRMNLVFRWGTYLLISLMILGYFKHKITFIYFQF
ncbi:MBOAT family protein, partial [candidate division CSSED10-310 bacterium]